MLERVSMGGETDSEEGRRLSFARQGFSAIGAISGMIPAGLYVNRYVRISETNLAFSTIKRHALYQNELVFL